MITKVFELPPPKEITAFEQGVNPNRIGVAVAHTAANNPRAYVQLLIPQPLIQLSAKIDYQCIYTT
jgi:hypothetical protein